MGLFNRLFRPKLHDALIATKAINDAETNEIETYLIGNRGNPPARGVTELMLAYKRVPRLRNVINLISSTVASVGWKAGYFKQSSKKKTKAIAPPEFFRSAENKDRLDIIKSAKEDGEFQEIKNHPIITLLDGGNASMTGHDVRRLTETFMDLPGEAFWLLGKNGKGMPEVIFPVPPNWVTGTPTDGSPYYSVTWGSRVVMPEDMLWFRELDPTAPYSRGSGMGLCLADEIDTSEYISQLIKAAFYNRATPAGVVALEGAKGDDVKRYE
jgi:phage portal protein BeeE